MWWPPFCGVSFASIFKQRLAELTHAFLCLQPLHQLRPCEAVLAHPQALSVAANHPAGLELLY